MKANTTSVLVVGGGLAGLSSAMFLAWQGVSTILVERHPGSSPHPRAVGYTPRTMELFRAVGLGDRVPQAPPHLRLRRIRVESLAGKWFEETAWSPENAEAPKVEHSPCTGAAIAQDRLEPILRERAHSLGADIRLETELLRFDQDAGGVTATVGAVDGSSPSEYVIRADYMVAADGHRSPVRDALGIGRDGRGHMQTVRSVLFRAPLDEYLASGISQFNVEQPGFSAFLTTYGDGRWLLILPDDEPRDEATQKELVIRAIGRRDLDVDVFASGRWDLSALIADRFSSGRVFLAGDAAHTLPPSRGGYGANTGIEDAHNLAWKLAAVLSGAATPDLLDTYDAERRPIAWLRHHQIFARADYKAHAGSTGKDEPIIEDTAMELGQLYRSRAVVDGAPDGGVSLPPAKRPDQWSGQPGTRAPHLWVTKTASGERISTLDLLQRRWVLLADDDRWCSAVSNQHLDVDCVRLGKDVSPAEEVQRAFGLAPGGASLVRPDGYVGWRSVELPTDLAVALATMPVSLFRPRS